jgi:chromatin remodeling complex protein RSC6
MPRKTSKKTTEPVVESTIDNQQVVLTKKAKKPSKNTEVVLAVEETVETEPVVSDEVVSDEVVSDEVVSDVEFTRKRKVPTRETVVESFDDLVNLVESEIVRLRETQNKAKGVKFLRSLNKRIKSLRGQTTRVMKQRHRTNRKNNNNSGFLKPVKISSDMAKFTGWDAADLHSRVDVTKFICNYIRENDLQNPSDRRQIIADSKLSKLLKYDAKKAADPLTYYRIQSYMKDHFIRDEPVVV